MGQRDKSKGCLYVQEEGSELGPVIGNPDTQEAHLPTALGSLGLGKERESFQAHWNQGALCSMAGGGQRRGVRGEGELHSH